MAIHKLPDFEKELENILDYIAKDSLNRALEFNHQIEQQINSIIDMPLKCRKSIHFNDDNIRDLIFKSYTITYYINDKTIILLGIKKNKKDFLVNS
ncbi:MAG: type II toxin-antitoxin system RelE/ParE family toxin [Epsilonproteobacteria bacterium]|nr:type II toxin-antitoxin system RelE/ParE family toxin [Campylobacterota bacterium]